MDVPDVQASIPATPVSLSRVGVTNVEKVARIGAQLYYAKLDCFVELGPEQKGAHMSRFEEVVNDVIGEVVLGEGGFKAEQLAQRIAVEVRERQAALRAEVTIAARYPEHKPAPVSGIPTQEIYTLFGSAVASARGTRRLVGVAAQGMTASPSVQQLVAERSRERLAARSPTSSRPCRSRRRTSAASARSTSGCPRSATPTSTRRTCSRSSRTRCPARSTS
jgi:GTP cyclohydrolase-4